MSADIKQELTALEQERERRVTRIFWHGFEIAIIFAVPAALVVLFGRGLGSSIAYVLAGTFVLSWVIVAFRYRQLSKQMKALDEKIASLKRQSGASDHDEASDDEFM